MRIDKKPVIDKMYFVYTLSYKGVIFYVGKTKDVHKRYCQHLYNATNGRIKKILDDIIKNSEYPKLNIITYTNAIHAHNIEETLIKLLTQGGQPLTNICHTIVNPPEFKDFKSKQEAINTIVNEQNDYIHKCNRRMGYYIVPTIGEKHHFPEKYHS